MWLLPVMHWSCGMLVVASGTLVESEFSVTLVGCALDMYSDVWVRVEEMYGCTRTVVVYCRQVFVHASG